MSKFEDRQRANQIAEIRNQLPLCENCKRSYGECFMESFRKALVTSLDKNKCSNFLEKVLTEVEN